VAIDGGGTTGSGNLSALPFGPVSAPLLAPGGLSGLLIAGAVGSAESGLSFGPAALLSLGLPTPADDGANLYANLAGLAFRPATAAQLSPQQQAAEKALIKQAFDLIDSARAGQARELVAAAARKSPGRATLIHVQGMLETAAGEYAKAEAFFRKAASIDPSLGSLDEAESARVLQQDDAAVLARVRRLLAQKNTRGAGYRLLDTLTTRSPQNTEALLLKGDALLKDGSQIKALVAYARAISTADEAELGLLESRFADLVRKSPNDAFAHNLLGKVQLRLGRNAEALASLETATRLAVDPSSYRLDEAQAHLAIGRDLLNRRNIAEAMASFDRAVGLAPEDAHVRLGRAEGYAARAESRARAGDAARAVADYERAARDARGSSDEAAALRERIARGAYSLGRQLERRRIDTGGDVGQEVVAFQTAFDLDPENATYRRKLAETRRTIGDEHMADNEYAAAATAYRRAYDLERSNTTYRDLAINAFTADGQQKLSQLRYDDAIAALRQAFSLNSLNDTSRSKLATAYNLAGLDARDNDQDRERAAAYFREALHLYPDNQEYLDNYNSVYP
jgi:tetratricopeptide (TPR) repeat protein